MAGGRMLTEVNGVPLGLMPARHGGECPQQTSACVFASLAGRVLQFHSGDWNRAAGDVVYQGGLCSGRAWVWPLIQAKPSRAELT